MKPRKLKIRFNENNFRWEYIGTEEEVQERRLREEYDNSPIVATIKKLVKQGGGRWEGSADTIKRESMYFQSRIYDDVSQIGKKINKYEVFLHFDSIDFKFKRNGKTGNKYIFTDTTVTPDTTDTTVTTDTEQIALDLMKAE